MDDHRTEVLSAKNLSIGFKQNRAARCIAKDLQLALHAGELVCLLGPNGSGKSTLIRSLGGMQAPISGSVSVGNADFHTIPPRQRARLVSVVLTEALPAAMMDAYAMVALGRHPYSGWFGSLNAHDRERIEWALTAAGAKTLATRQVAELSDGERQKISIARALAQETRVMLLDEPTAFLDLPRRVELMRNLRDLAHREKLGLLLSTHDLDLALRFADRLWILNQQGELIQGYPEALAMSGDFAKIFESESLDWDPAIGSFRAHPESCLRARVIGEGVSALWTQRAVERLGFGLTESGNTAFTVSIKNETSWEAKRGKEETALGSISELIEWIRRQDWTT